MNQQSKERLRKMNNLLVSKLEESFGVSVYQDSVSEDEEEGYHYFIFETGGFTKSNTSNSTLIQDVLVRYYSENRDDLDERVLDIISLLEGIGYFFKNSIKEGIQIGDTDAYIDGIEINLTRNVKYGC